MKRRTDFAPTIRIPSFRCRLLCAAAALLASCRAEYHPYDTRIDGPTGINARNIARIEEACAGRHTLRFAVIGDTQRWYDETKAAVEALNRRDDIDFVLHTGDLADFGLRAEFERQRDILDRLRIPYVVLLGNHDCLGTGREVFAKIFGKADFAFTAGNVRMVCLNTNALEFGHEVAVPDFGFLGRQIAEYPAEAGKTVVAMHTKPFTEQFDDNVARVFQHTIRQFPALQFCVNGHGHNFFVEELFDDGVLYYECDNIGKRSYLVFTVDDEGYAYERVAF